MIYTPIVTDLNNGKSDIFSRLLDDRIVLVYGEINDELAAVVCSQLLYLDSQNKEDITMYINSPGGNIHSGFAILDTMNHIKSDVQTICMGHAASMGAILLSGGTKGKRFSLPNGEIMIHQPLGGTQGQSQDMEIAVNHIVKLRKKLYTYLSNWSGKSIEEIEKDSERDHWMDADEAKQYGLIDNII